MNYKDMHLLRWKLWSLVDDSYCHKDSKCFAMCVKGDCLLMQMKIVHTGK